MSDPANPLARPAGEGGAPAPGEGRAEPDFSDNDYDLDGVNCGECGGDGGYAICQEDCCPIEGGEECCDDPACWRVCPMCRGA